LNVHRCSSFCHNMGSQRLHFECSDRSPGELWPSNAQLGWEDNEQARRTFRPGTTLVDTSRLADGCEDRTFHLRDQLAAITFELTKVMAFGNPKLEIRAHSVWQDYGISDLSFEKFPVHKQ